LKRTLLLVVTGGSSSVLCLVFSCLTQRPIALRTSFRLVIQYLFTLNQVEHSFAYRLHQLVVHDSVFDVLGDFGGFGPVLVSLLSVIGLFDSELLCWRRQLFGRRRRIGEIRIIKFMWGACASQGLALGAILVEAPLKFWIASLCIPWVLLEVHRR